MNLYIFLAEDVLKPKQSGLFSLSEIIFPLIKMRFNEN